MSLPHPSALVPHRDEALLLDAIDDLRPDGLTASLVVGGHSSLAGPDGTLPAWAGPEIMAQAVSAFATSRKGPPYRPKPGLLLGVRHYRCECAAFARGAKLAVTIRESTRDDSGSAVFDATLALDGAAIAEGMLTVLEPEDVLEALAEQLA
jgi:predicted hotdog family 3-hydroxylacyl-ACP dehydratase